MASKHAGICTFLIHRSAIVCPGLKFRGCSLYEKAQLFPKASPDFDSLFNLVTFV